jgi:hypothetical protein
VGVGDRQSLSGSRRVPANDATFRTIMAVIPLTSTKKVTVELRGQMVLIERMALARCRLEPELPQALDRDELKLFYQPWITFADGNFSTSVAAKLCSDGAIRSAASSPRRSSSRMPRTSA